MRGGTVSLAAVTASLCDPFGIFLFFFFFFYLFPFFAAPFSPRLILRVTEIGGIFTIGRFIGGNKNDKYERVELDKKFIERLARSRWFIEQMQRWFDYFSCLNIFCILSEWLDWKACWDIQLIYHVYHQSVKS